MHEHRGNGRTVEAPAWSVPPQVAHLRAIVAPEGRR
jgi:hypothetical protein